jgi:hypothetical protein
MVDWEDRIGEDPDIVESAPRLEISGRFLLARVGAVLRRRRRFTLTLAFVVMVMVLAGVFVSGRASVNPAFAQTTDIPQSLLAAARNAPGSYQPSPQQLTGVPLLSQRGRPELVYAGPENCPDCATINWALAIALSRFGTFTGVRPIRSQAVGVLRADDTWSFIGARYVSDYLVFAVSTNGLLIVDQSVNAAPEQEGVASGFIASSGDLALDFANQSVWLGPLFPPNLLANRTWTQIAALLRSPSGRPVLAGADNIITAICRLTHNEPASACGR